MSDDSENCCQVKLGSRVKVALSDQSEKIFTISSSREANPSAGVISDQCPAGKALLGAKVGDQVSYQVGGNLFTAQVLEVSG